MAIKEKHLIIPLTARVVSHYEKLGYQIPRQLDKKGRLSVSRGTTLKVRIEDIPPTSKVKVTKICDQCGKVLENIDYGMIIRNRIEGNGLDRCNQCGSINGGKTRVKNVKHENSLEFYRPDLIIEWSNKNKVNMGSVNKGSNKQYIWCCQECLSEYNSSPKEKIKGKGCPFCYGSQVNTTNSLQSIRPDILLEWDYNLNKISPSNITYKSNYSAHWVCVDGHKWQSTVYHRTVTETNCPFCVGVQKTHEILVQDVRNLVGAEYTILSQYENATKKIMFRHNKCGYVYLSTSSNFLSGARCPECKGGVAYDDAKFRLKLVEKRESFFEDYTLLTKYINSTSPIRVKHIKCECEFESTGRLLLGGSGCPICYGYSKKNTDIFRRQVRLIAGGEFELVGEYKRDDEKTKVKHLTCNVTFDITPSNFIQRSKCPYCSGRLIVESNSLATLRSDLLNEWNYKRNRDIDPKETGTGSGKKVWWKCKNGHEWQAVVHSRSNGTGCPQCREKKGEEATSKFLLIKSLNFSRQKRFDDCKFKRPLSFDFAVYDTYNQLQCLIEYDGHQHFFPIMHWGGEKAFKLQQKKDKIKDDYCKANNIPLIRIPYWDFKNIDSILTERLTELGVLSPALVGM
nr:zinc-ribbon domain-containing protein [Paenibacillus xylanexedens]